MHWGAGNRRRGRRRGRVGLGLAAGLAAALAAAPPAPAQPAPAGGPSSLPAGVRTEHHRGFPAVELAALVGPVFGDGSVRGTEARVRAGPDVLVLRAGSPFVRRADDVFQLANAPYLAEGRFWVPLELLSPRHRVRAAAQGGPAPSSGEPAASTPVESASAGSVPAAAIPSAREASGRARRTGPWRVVIDPGHGGRDPGTVSRRNGSREKDVTLAIARRLHRLLEARPEFEPLLTRTDDRFIRLADRSRLATAREADLFVSIHVNAQESGSGAAGFETYFLSQARTEESKRVAMRENSVLELEGETDPGKLDALQYILASLDQSENVRESSRFAGFVQNELRRGLSSDDRGVKQAGFYVLMGATGSMPAVLVETGFITNPADERVLRSDAGQRSIAGSLERAIVAYFDEVDRRLQRLSAAAGE